MWIWIWIILAVFCLVLELFSGDFFVTCLAVGALVAAGAAGVGLNWLWCLAIFAVCSLLCLLFLRPPLVRWLHKGEDARVSNAEAVIGREGRVSQAIEQDGYGRVAIDGDDWKARSIDGGAIAEGARVRVISMDSIILTVEAI